LTLRKALYFGAGTLKAELGRTFHGKCLEFAVLVMFVGTATGGALFPRADGISNRTISH
jgi:hypothetical protein